MSGIEAAFFGALGRDAERKTSKGGNRYLRLNVRVGSGDAAQWVNVTAFDASAIEAADKFIKNAKVYVEGTLRLDEWERDGVQRSGLSVLSWHCRLAAIGRNRPKRKPSVSVAGATVGMTERAHVDAGGGAIPFNDEIPF